MNYLIFDTETSSLPSKELPANHPKQARILQLAMLRLDQDFKEVGSFCSLIQPSTDFEIHPAALKTHGITKDKCMKHGIPIGTAIGMYANFIPRDGMILGFNLPFDKQMIAIEESILLNKEVPPLIGSCDFCVMRAMTGICKLPPKFKGTEYKWPSLQEAYTFCFGKPFAKSHDALADVRATASVYRWYRDYMQVKDSPEQLAQAASVSE